jgi:hypothetical protein
LALPIPLPLPRSRSRSPAEPRILGGRGPVLPPRSDRTAAISAMARRAGGRARKRRIGSHRRTSCPLAAVSAQSWPTGAATDVRHARARSAEGAYPGFVRLVGGPVVVAGPYGVPPPPRSSRRRSAPPRSPPMNSESSPRHSPTSSGPCHAMMSAAHAFSPSMSPWIAGQGEGGTCVL